MIKKKSFGTLVILGILCMGLLGGCGVGTGDSGGAVTTTTIDPTAPVPPPPAAAISLGTDALSVKSDNSDSATITATVLDGGNAVIKGIDVTFAASGGTISAPLVTTDANGQASIKLRSGTQDQSNQVVTVTATASGKSTQIPIQVSGSTLSMSSLPTVSIPSDGTTVATLTVTAKNAGGIAVRSVPVTLSASGAGRVNLSPASGTTGLDGKVQIQVSGAVAGTATVRAEGLGTAATYDYTITGPAAAVFGITAPAVDPATKVTGAPLTLTVSAPTSANVTFATTLGVWDGGTSQVITKAVSGGSVSATIISTEAGFATVQTYDSASPATTDSIGVAFYAPASAAAQISLQAAATVLGLSTSGISKTTTVRATVLSSIASGNKPVGDAPVAFSLTNSTGGGEFISPVVAYTDATGRATATFTSGSVSTGAAGVSVSAQVLGSGPPVVTAAPVKIIIGGTAGSVVIGLGTEIKVLNPTTYALPMSVLVADSSGARVEGAVVSLKLWPAQYSSGAWYNELAYDPDNPDKVRYRTHVTGTFDNDDVNENLTREPGENSDPDGSLRPPNSAAGDLPPTVTTGANGVANFDLVYLKGSGAWIRDRVRATTVVFGTETSSSITFTLPVERGEAELGRLHNSNFPIDLTVAATPGATVSYLVPAWNSRYVIAPATETYATSSPYSTITSPGRTIPPVYTFTAPAGVTAGAVYHDYISASDGGSTWATGMWVRIVAR